MVEKEIFVCFFAFFLFVSFASNQTEEEEGFRYIVSSFLHFQTRMTTTIPLRTLCRFSFSFSTTISTTTTTTTTTKTTPRNRGSGLSFKSPRLHGGRCRRKHQNHHLQRTKSSSFSSSSSSTEHGRRRRREEEETDEKEEKMILMKCRRIFAKSNSENSLTIAKHDEKIHVLNLRRCRSVSIS